MLKKAAGIILLSIGGFLLFGSCVVSSIWIASDMLERFGRKNAAISILVPAVLAALSILPGLALWNWKRWRIVLGTVFTAVGSLSALGGINFALLMLSPEIWEAAGGSKLPISNLLVIILMFSSAVLLIAGIPLIIKQKKLDGG